MSDTNRVLGGYKATLSNPNTSEAAKEHAAEVLADAGVEVERGTTGTGTSGTSEEAKHEHRVLGGYKATLSNPNTSEEAKAHAREILEAHDYSYERPADVTEDEHDRRVLGGYKAALNNPRVSEAAKEHAREVLQQYGALE